MDLLVVGAGEMGRWLADVVADADPDATVAFADRDPSVASDAVGACDAGDARAVALDGPGTFDVVALAVPMSAVVDAVATHAPRAGRAVVDVTGVMEPVVTAWRDHAPDRERLSLHPLFAPANEPGNVAVVHDARGPLTDRLRDALSARGNRVFDTTPAVHDEAMATVQAGAHAAVLAYALVTADAAVPDPFATPVSAGLDDLVATVTGNDARVYREIQATFDGADALARAVQRVADAEGEAFDRLYAEATAAAQADRPDDEGSGA